MNNKKILTKFCAISLIPISLLSPNTVMGMKSSTPNANQNIHKKHSMSHNDFIKHFNEDLYNKEIPYDDKEMKYLEINEKNHQEIKKYFIDNNPVNKELAKKVYAELMWLNYNGITNEEMHIYNIMALFGHHRVLFDSDINALFEEFRSNKNTSNESLNEFISKNSYCKTYSDFAKAFQDQRFPIGICHFNFIKKIYNEEIQSIFEQSTDILRQYFNMLSATNSNSKRKIAIENIDVIIDKFNALIKTNNDPTLTTLSQGMIVFLCQPIKEMIENDLKESKPSKTPEFKQFPSESESKPKYVPYYSNSLNGKPKIKHAGSGGFGTVEIYKDTEKNEKVAIKTLHNSALGEKFDIDLIEKLKAIKSPHVMELREVIDLPDNKQGLVMEYIHGNLPVKCALHNIKRFTKSKVLDICMQIADGLNAFNKAKFIHPDMCQHPNNVVIDKNNQVKIIDYDNSYSFPFNNCRKNDHAALNLIATALYVSYKDLYKIFINKFSSLLYSEVTNNFSRYPVKMYSCHGQPLPTIDEIKTVLKDMKSEIEKTE